MRHHEITIRKPTYFVLASLDDEPLCGRAIIGRAEELSAGQVRLATGALYMALDRLTAAGYVSPVSEETVGGRVRRYYGLTDAGRCALRAQAPRHELAARMVTEAGHPEAVAGIVVVGGRVRVGGKASTA